MTELMHDSTRRNYAKMDWEKFEGYIKTAAQTLRGRNLSIVPQVHMLITIFISSKFQV
jgi:hypothetical protein